jgi:hypothetical protein
VYDVPIIVFDNKGNVHIEPALINNPVGVIHNQQERKIQDQKEASSKMAIYERRFMNVKQSMKR